MRTVLALFVAGFAMEMLSFFIGVFGCWRRSAALLISTGTLMLVACKSPRIADEGALIVAMPNYHHQSSAALRKPLFSSILRYEFCTMTLLNAFRFSQGYFTQERWQYGMEWI